MSRFTITAMTEAPITPPMLRQKPTIEEETPMYFGSTLIATAVWARLICGPTTPSPSRTTMPTICQNGFASEMPISSKETPIPSAMLANMIVRNLKNDCRNPTTIAPTMTEAIIGVSRAFEPLRPSTYVANTGKYEMAENMIAPWQKTTKLVPDTIRLRKMPRGSIGSGAARSTKKKETPATAESANKPRICQEVQAKSLPPSSSPNMIDTVVTTIRNAPRKSIFGLFAAFDSRREKSSTRNEAMPIGRLM